MIVFVYPEKTREEFGAERWQASWDQVRASASLRVRMVQQNAKAKHEREKHEAELDKCTDKACERARYTEIDIDSDLNHYTVNFRGPDAKEKAVAYARKTVNGGKTAFGVVSARRQVVDWYVEEDRVAEWADTNDVEEVLADA